MRARQYLPTLLLAAIAARAQQSSVTQLGQPAIIRAESRLVLVDAVVTDRQGRPVRDLDRGDFRLWEDGHERQIASVTLETAGRAPDRRHNSYVLLFFDGANGNPGAMAQFRRDASRFVSTAGAPDRYMAVAYFAKALQVAQNFTAMPEPLIRAIGAAPAIGLAPTEPMSAFRPFNAPPIPGTDQVYAQGAFFSSLRLLVESMGAIRGRKALVLFTAGFPRSPDLDPEVAATVAACSRANVVVYAIDSGSVLRDLTEQTGGRLMHAAGDLIQHLGRIEDEQEEYYLLGFVPPESPEGSCHALRVRVERTGIDVRARSRYCTVKPPALPADATSAKAIEERAAGSSGGEMTATMQLPYFYLAANLARVMVAMDIAPVDVRFQNVKGKLHAELLLLGTARTADGVVAARFRDTVNLDFDSKKEAAEFLKRPYHYENQFDLGAGRYTFQMVVSAGQGHFGKAEMPLVIEPWDGKTLALSGLAVGNATRQVTNLAAALEDGLLEDRRPLLAGSLETIPAGSNRCHPPAPCVAFLEVYSSSALGSSAPPPMLQVRILDRRTGEQKLDSGPFSIAAYARPGNPVTPVPLTLPVAGLAAGSYLVEIRAGRPPAPAAVRTSELEIN